MTKAFDDGWLAGVRREPSSNFDARPEGQVGRLLVIHAISLPPGEYGGKAVVEFFTNRLDCSAHPYYSQIEQLRVSAHFLICRTGELIQFVSCDSRAWHAGVSTWRGQARCNDYSIGIELEGCDEMPFEEPQYAVLAKLVQSLRAAYPVEEIVGHSDIAPGRKTDPGPYFDWRRIASPP